MPLIPNKEFEYYLENFGGNFNLGYGYEDVLDDENKNKGWSRFLNIVKDSPTDMNAMRALKQMKGEKKVIDIIQHNKYKDLMIQNENVLKSFVYTQYLADKAKENDTTPNSRKHKTPIRHETKQMVSDLINDKSFLLKVKNDQFKTIKNDAEAMRDAMFTPDFDKEETEHSKSKTKSKTSEMMDELNSIAKRITLDSSNLSLLGRRTEKNRTKNNFQSIRTMSNHNMMTRLHSRKNTKRGTQDVITQLINIQRNMKRDKDKDNYCSDESDSSDIPDEEERKNKRGVICLPRMENLPNETSIHKIEEASDSSFEKDSSPKKMTSMKSINKSQNGFRIHSTNKCPKKRRFRLYSTTGNEPMSIQTRIQNKKTMFNNMFSTTLKPKSFSPPAQKRDLPPKFTFIHTDTLKKEFSPQLHHKRSRENSRLGTSSNQGDRSHKSSVGNTMETVVSPVSRVSSKKRSLRPKKMSKLAKLKNRKISYL